MRNRSQKGGAAAALFLPPLLYLFLAMAAAWPFSLHPGRFFPVNRTASKHAVTMYHFGDYFRGGGRPVAFLDLWNWPEGGIAKPQGIPSLAMGWPLSRALPPRTAFNLLMLFNLALSGFAFHLLGRRIGVGEVPAAALGTLAAFHPVAQSFLQRGQIENTALWTSGFALLALASVALDEEPRGGAVAAAVLLPVATLFSTAYHALFLLMAEPLLILFLMARNGIGWRDRGVRRAAMAALGAMLLVAAGAQFYRPGGAGALPNLHPNTLQLGPAGATPASSLADLVDPREMMAREKPYLGLSFLACLLPAWAALLARRRGMGAAAVLLPGTLIFALVALGREVGGTPLPAALADRLLPDFHLFTMTVRALPFMALFGGLAVALALERLPGRVAPAALGLAVLFTMADHLAVNPPAARTAPAVMFDEARDLDPVIRSLPRFREADLPLADLPPPRGRMKFLWNRYTWSQSGHLQKVVWSDAVPDPPRGLPALLEAAWERPGELAGDPARRREWAAEVRRTGLRTILLHKEFVSHNQALLLSSVLDPVFERTGDSARVTAWAVTGDVPSPRASSEAAGMKSEGM